MEYRKQMGCEDANFRGIGLSSRKNLCLHPEVSPQLSRGAVCGDLTDKTRRVFLSPGRAGEEGQDGRRAVSRLDECSCM